MRVFRTGAWIWIGYLAAMAFMDTSIYAAAPKDAVVSYYLANGGLVLAFLSLSYSPWIRSHARIFGPVMIFLASIAPILVNYLFDLHLPQAPLANMEGMVLRQLPVLFVGLVLVAWHYNAVAMIGYSLTTCALDLALNYLLVSFDRPRFTPLLYVVTVRTIAFIVVGIFVHQLIAILRAQHNALRAANLELVHHASTLETLVTSRERNRLARELHDTLAHTLSGLAVQLETTKAYWSDRPETALLLLQQSLDTTRSGLDETRRALKSLRASPLEDLGLRLALRQLAEAGAARGGLELDLSLPDDPPALPPDVEQTIYRVAQEAIENVIKHSGARRLAVRLAAGDGDVSVTVRDDGRGVDMAEAGAPGHFGIAGMRERALLAGGTLTIEGMPGQGTTVRLTLKGCRP